jgi:hypothetical protein
MKKREGFRNVRGGTVIDLQKGLSRSTSTPVAIDGVFGSQTKAALQLWQNANGFEPSGEVDELTWKGLTHQDLPKLFRRCLAITAAFEGHGYTFAAGNWDDAYLTWGVIGFTLKHGNLKKVLEKVETRHPGLMAQTIGPDMAGELLKIIKSNAATRRVWGNSISVSPKKYRIRADWEDAFEMLGNRPEIRQIQDEVAREVYWCKALSDMKKYGAQTEADAALFFDTAVQNGGINAKKAALITEKRMNNPGVDGRDRLTLIAEAIAEGSNAKFAADVLSRKACIAQGTGKVHGSSYYIQDWAVDYIDADDADLPS